MDGVVKTLEEASNYKLFKKFSDKLMKNDAGKCHLLVITNSTAIKSGKFWYKKESLWETLRS